MHTGVSGAGRWIAGAGLAGAFMLLPAAAFAQDLTLHGTTTVKGQDTPTTTYFSVNATRTATGDGRDVIVRLDAKKIFIIDAKRQTYTEMTFDDMQKMAAAATAGMENMPPEAAAQMKRLMGGGGGVTVTPTGAGETIAGYATEKYHVVLGSMMDIDLWVAPALVTPPVFYDAMQAIVPSNPMMDMKKLFEEYKKIKGMQLKSVTNMKMMGQAITTTTVVTSVDKGPIPAGTFDVPAGYKPVPMK